jgi:alpha-L-fucosidase 2
MSNQMLDQHDLIWETPPRRWLEGIPLANGDIGALIWGDGAPLKITLDKYDAWETRERRLENETYEELRALVEAGKKKEAEDYLACWRIYDDGLDPTRLPLPRMEVCFGTPIEWETGRLRLRRAVADISGAVDGEPVRVETMVHAERNVLRMHLRGRGARDAKVHVGWEHLDEGTRQRLVKMGYPEPEVESGSYEGSWHLKAPSGYELAIAWSIQDLDEGAGRGVRAALLSSEDAEDPLAAAKELSRRFGNPSVETHERWWKRYWERSSLTIPDARLEALYCAEMYKLGCSSRPGKLPITLQGLWTLDGRMPPWSGDYHLDMNVQQSYWPVYASNRLELGEPLYRTFSACIPRWRQQCKQFFGFDGVWSGCAICPKGERIFGYSGVELWPGNCAWLAHHYWLHYLYSLDRNFLRDEALPLMQLAFLTYANLLEPGEDGKLHVPLSHSPEWGEGKFEAYCKDPNVDIALIRFLGQSILESHEILGSTDPVVDRAREVLENLVGYVREGNRLLVSENTPLSHSHRHFSHLMAIHPLGLLTIDGTEEERDLIRGSLREIRVKGTGEWTGWSYPWMSLIASRAGLGNTAWQMLDVYCNSFISPNTFQTNGDPRLFGLSQWDYEPMTLEAGFGAAAAVMEMLLQSYNGCIRLFPSIPDRWHDAYFRDLRAEGAFVVTAKLENDRVRFVRIRSEKGGSCKVKNPFTGRKAEMARFAAGGSELTGKLKVLSGDVLSFETSSGGDYLLFPKGARPTETEMNPTTFTRSVLERNFYGKKLRARF